MSLFDRALSKQQTKRFDRLKEVKKKAKLDAQKYPYATYQGKDPVDGTDIVQTGANEATSGFRLISNSPMGVGDRVALRKNNQGGLQRVDDINRVVNQEEEDDSPIVSVNVICSYSIQNIPSDGNGGGIFGELLATLKYQNGAIQNALYTPQETIDIITGGTDTLLGGLGLRVVASGVCEFAFVKVKLVLFSTTSITGAGTFGDPQDVTTTTSIYIQNELITTDTRTLRLNAANTFLFEFEIDIPAHPLTTSSDTVDFNAVLRVTSKKIS
jgi:hypothetical protein